jgi:hypothetical protein
VVERVFNHDAGVEGTAWGVEAELVHRGHQGVLGDRFCRSAWQESQSSVARPAINTRGEMAPKRQSISSVYPAPEQARRNWSRKSMVGARKRGILRFLRAQKGKEILKHSQTTYVDELQLTTLLIPLTFRRLLP